MRKVAQIASVFVLTAIYCFAIGVATTSFASEEHHHSTSDEQDKCFSHIASGLTSQISQSESAISGANGFPNQGFKITFDALSVYTKTFEGIVETRFTQYTKLSLNVLIHHRKSDSIFPFHYFW